MADVKQSVQWLVEGKKVVRQEWKSKGDIWLERLPDWSHTNAIHCFSWHEPMERYYKSQYQFSISDLLADDWEIKED